MLANKKKNAFHPGIPSLAARQDGKPARIRQSLVRRLIPIACLALWVASPLTEARQPATATARTNDAEANDNRLVRNGVVVEFAAESTAGRKELIEGDNAEVKFRIRDAATGAPLKGRNPSGWLDIGRDSQEKGARDQSCRDRIGLYLKGIVGIRPLLDLNSYFLLVMNQDASISVIDPVVGMTGKTNLYGMIMLNRPGADWVNKEDAKRLFVTMPEANQVAVVDTNSFKVINNLDTGENPARVALQPDGKYLWVGNDGSADRDGGVTVVDTDTLQVLTTLATGRGHHEITFSSDDRHAFVSNRNDGSVTVIDVPSLQVVKKIETGGVPISLGYSSLGKALYIADSQTGMVNVVDGARLKVVSRIQAKPGLGPMAVTPDGRWVLVVNPAENAVLAIDTATNRVTQSIPVAGEPYQIVLTRGFAHIRALGTERVSMINLATLGREAVPPNTYAAGTSAPQLVPDLRLARAMAPAPAEAAVYVVSPADNAIYYYMEGMNAPSGSFQTYGHSARAIQIIDRSLQEREPGLYSAKVKIPVAGDYDVAFLLDSPRLVHCFHAAVKADPAAHAELQPVGVQYLLTERKVKAGRPFSLRFRLEEPKTHAPRTGIEDAQVLYYAAPGALRNTAEAREVEPGLYEAALNLPRAGAYYVYVGVPSLKLGFSDLPYLSVMAEGDGPVPSPQRPAGNR